MKKSELRQIIKEEIKRVLEENTDGGFMGKTKDFFKFRSTSQLGKAVTQILDRLENLPEVIDAKKEGMKLYKLQKLIRSKATPEEYKLLQYVVDYGDKSFKVPLIYGNPKMNAVKKVYNSKIGLRMAKMGFFIQTMTNRYTGNYPLNSSPEDFR
tara:strand:+ start:529 stop:990 length:462 start_codon:yes stop_codon:yes gene_type:complete